MFRASFYKLILFCCFIFAGQAEAGKECSQFEVVPSDEQLLNILTGFAAFSCFEGSSPVMFEKAREIAQCFMHADFWKAYNKHQHRSSEYVGTGLGIAVECSEKLGVACLENFLRLGTHARHGKIHMIDQPGHYQIGGFGASSKVVVLIPGVRVHVDVSGHSQIYYISSRPGEEPLQTCNDRGCVGTGSFPIGAAPLQPKPAIQSPNPSPRWPSFVQKLLGR